MSAASERAKVNGKCPACGSGGLFVGSGGYLTCPWAECPNPSAPHDALTFTRQSRAEIQAEAWERGVDDEIRFAQEELRGAVPDIRNPYRIREGGERG